MLHGAVAAALQMVAGDTPSPDMVQPLAQMAAALAGAGYSVVRRGRGCDSELLAAGPHWVGASARRVRGVERDLVR